MYCVELHIKLETPRNKVEQLLYNRETNRQLHDEIERKAIMERVEDSA